MSTLYVDTITEKTSGNGVQIPGHVVQVVQSEISTGTIPSNANWTALTLTLTITPKFSTSKILISHNSGGLVQNTLDIGFRMKRDGTVIWTRGRVGYQDLASNWTPISWTMEYLDSPATASAITYSWEIKQDNASGLLRWNDSGGSGSGIAIATAMEIAQ